MDYRYAGKEFTKVSSGKSLPKTKSDLLKKINTKKFRDSRCHQEILRLNEEGNLENFIQNVVDVVQIAAAAYQNPMAGLKGGKKKNSQKKKTHRKRKTRKHKEKEKLQKKKNTQKTINNFI